MRINIGELDKIVRIASEYNARQVVLNILSGKDYPYMANQDLRNYPLETTAGIDAALKQAKEHDVDLSIPPVFQKIYEENIDQISGFNLKPQAPSERISEYDKGTDFSHVTPTTGPETNSSSGLKLAETAEEIYGTDSLPESSPVTEHSCQWPWRAYVQGIDGTVNPCYSRIELGNLRRQSMSEIWNGDGYQALRKTVHGYNPNESCQKCPYGFGIGGGDADLFDSFFRSFEDQRYSISDPVVNLVSGFHDMEGTDSEQPWVWMKRSASLGIEVNQKPQFLAFHIFPGSPTRKINPGKIRVSGEAWHYFDTSASTVYLPTNGNEAGGLVIEIEMQNSWYVGEDTRELGLAICGLSLLFGDVNPESSK